MSPVIFREYDIRGVYKKDFDEEFAYDLGRAFATFLHQEGFIKDKSTDRPVITVGNDARLSSPQLVEALSKGIASTGSQAIQLGLVTTPISYYSTFTMDKVDGAIMITGSHNPPEYNGFKISAGKATIFGEKIQRLHEIIKEGQFLEGQGSITEHDIFPDYVDRYKKEL